MSKYYCLIAGLPDLLPDDRKLSFSTPDFRKELNNTLSPADKALMDLHNLEYDNRNLLQYLKDKETDFDERGVISKAVFAEVIRRIREEESLKGIDIPAYFLRFIQEWQDENPLSERLSREDQLSELYQDYLLTCRNEFFSAWFELNLDISNIRIALSAGKYGYEIASLIVGNNETARQIRSSNAKDFGLPGKFAGFGTLQRILDEPDLLQREKKIDMLKWNWLDEQTFFFNFSIENVFAYLLKLEMVERWLVLHKDTGEKMLRQLVATLRAEVTVPDGFK